MTHIVAGYPSLKASYEIAAKMAMSGVDFVEIQIPFSDPVADGPVIMNANQKALDAGIKLKDSLELMKKLSKKFPGTKFLFMSYFNILFNYGVEKFCNKAANCGCYGLIVPDMSIDEEKNEKYLESCAKYGLRAIQVISPLTSEKRLKKIAAVAEGFVYCVARYGTTGSGDENLNLKSYLNRVKKIIKLPLAVGFGIYSKSQVDGVFKDVEIAVIGSKILRIINENPKNYLREIEKFLKELA